MEKVTADRVHDSLLRAAGWPGICTACAGENQFNHFRRANHCGQCWSKRRRGHPKAERKTAWAPCAGALPTVAIARSDTQFQTSALTYGASCLSEMSYS